MGCVQGKSEMREEKRKGLNFAVLQSHSCLNKNNYILLLARGNIEIPLYIKIWSKVSYFYMVKGWKPCVTHISNKDHS